MENQLLQQIIDKIDRIELTMATKEALTSLEQRQDSRFKKLEKRIEGQDIRFDKLEEKFDGQDGRFNKLEEKFNCQDGRFDKLEEKFDGQDGRFNKLEEKIEDVNNNLSRQANRNFDQIVRNTEKLTELANSKERQERILEILSLRSIEHESK